MELVVDCWVRWIVEVKCDRVIRVVMMEGWMLRGWRMELIVWVV